MSAPGPVAAAPGLRARLVRPALYAGGFLGPFGGGVVSSMLPELGADFGVSPGSASFSLTAYLLPFAALMLVSGTLGQRFGPVRTVRLAYTGYVLVSLLCAVSPTLVVFLGARVLQGVGNAFTTPLLLASIAAATPRERLGRTLGVFGSLQAAGQTTAPLIGGLAAAVAWQWAFVGIAAVAAVLALIGLPDAPPGDGPPPSLRAALAPAVLRVGLLALLGWACLGGCTFLVSYRVADAFALPAGARGALLAASGVAGMLTARLVGRAVDRFGPRAALRAGLSGGAALMIGIGLLPAVLGVAALWAVTGLASQLVLVGVNASVLDGGSGNRGGAVGVVQSLRFFGAAAAPAAFTPLYKLNEVLPFGTAAALLLAGALTLLWPGMLRARTAD